MGINPVAFAGADMGCLCYKTCSKCPENWHQHDWQAPAGYMSREGLAFAIQDAERDIENFLGVPLCPQERCKVLPFLGYCQGATTRVSVSSFPDFHPWMAAYPHDHPKARRREPAYDIGDCPLFFLPRMAEKLLCTACRGVAITILDTVGDTYENDGAHCPRWAEIVCRVARPEEETTEAATAEIQACEVEIRHVDGDKICGRHIVSVVYDEIEDEDVITIRVDVWHLVDPELLEFAGPMAVQVDNACLTTSVSLLDPDNLVECVEVWRRYHDPSLPMVEFCWEPSGYCTCHLSSCELCNPTCCPGCVVQNTRQSNGFVLAHPAKWNPVTGSWCADDTCARCKPEPDFVKFYYWTGYLPNGQCPPTSLCDVDCSALERIIAIMAAARMVHQICSCTCDKGHWWQSLQTDTSFSIRNAGSYFINSAISSNPFGTRLGELESYRKLDLIKRELCGGYVSSTAV